MKEWPMDYTRVSGHAEVYSKVFLRLLWATGILFAMHSHAAAQGTMDTVRAEIHGSVNLVVQTPDLIVVGADSRSLKRTFGKTEVFRSECKIGINGGIAFAFTGQMYLGKTFDAINLADKATIGAKNARDALSNFKRLYKPLLKKKLLQMKAGHPIEGQRYKAMLDTVLLTVLFAGFCDGSTRTYGLNIIPCEINGKLFFPDSVSTLVVNPGNTGTWHAGFGLAIINSNFSFVYGRTGRNPVATVRSLLEQVCDAYPLEVGRPIYIAVVDRHGSHWEGEKPPRQKNPFE